MAETIGVIIGAWFWPWLLSAVFRGIGQKRHAAAWTGFFVASVIAAAVAAGTGFPPFMVGLFVLFGLGWTALRTRKPEPRELEEEDDQNDDPALRELIDHIEAPQPKARAKRKPKPSAQVEAQLASEQPQVSRTPKRSCSSCDEENDTDAAYCVACGVSLLEQTCRACQQVNVAKARFCKRCGAELVHAGTP